MSTAICDIIDFSVSLYKRVGEVVVVMCIGVKQYGSEAGAAIYLNYTAILLPDDLVWSELGY